MSEHPDLPETPKPTRERKDFFEKLTNPAGQEKPVCRGWDRQHARDMSEAPLHIKLQKFTELQVRGKPRHIMMLHALSVCKSTPPFLASKTIQVRI